jgi:hypothetical protein
VFTCELDDAPLDQVPDIRGGSPGRKDQLQRAACDSFFEQNVVHLLEEYGIGGIRLDFTRVITRGWRVEAGACEEAGRWRRLEVPAQYPTGDAEPF